MQQQPVMMQPGMMQPGMVQPGMGMGMMQPGMGMMPQQQFAVSCIYIIIMFHKGLCREGSV